MIGNDCGCSFACAPIGNRETICIICHVLPAEPVVFLYFSETFWHCITWLIVDPVLLIRYFLKHLSTSYEPCRICLTNFSMQPVWCLKCRAPADTVIDSQLVQAMEVSSAMVEKVRNDSHGRCLAAEDIRLLKCLEDCLDIHMLSCFQVSQSSWHSEFPEGKEHVSRQSTQTRAELRKIAGICQKGGASNCSCSLIAGVWSDATVEICWMLRHLFQVRSQKPDYCRLVGCQCPVLFCLSHDLQWFSLTSLTLFPEACPEISSRDKVIMKDTINEPSPRFYIFCCGLWIAKILNIDGLRLLAWKDCVGWFSPY